ncbi:MAG: redoxin domain-containing protein [Prevotella sp.]|nr:redoxin domain-containing protein [Prevotella sp.]
MKQSLRSLLPAVLATFVIFGCKPKAADQPLTPADEATAMQEADVFGTIEIPNIERIYVSPLEEIGKHKLTVIDFWASWCGPCRRVMPYVKQLYEQYQPQGLGIIGISLDEDEHAWKQAIDEMELPWMQLSELQGWDNTYVHLYNIDHIPYTILVDQQGKVIAAGMNIGEVYEYVSAYFGSEEK